MVVTGAAGFWLINIIANGTWLANTGAAGHWLVNSIATGTWLVGTGAAPPSDGPPSGPGREECSRSACWAGSPGLQMS
jgi:hypothetical protein